MKVQESGVTIGVKIPHKFVSDVIGFEGLTWYQDVVLYLMHHFPRFFWVACRGISKSYMVAWFLVTRAILFPRSRIVIASGSRGSARLIVTQKVMGELYNNFPVLQQEISKHSVSLNDTYVSFHGGSQIVVVTGADSARGNRACAVIYEEARTLDKNVIVNILSKFKNSGDRRPRWKEEPKYRNVKTNEVKQDIFISSGWWVDHYFYNISMDAFNAMIEGKNQALLSMHWGFPVVEGFLDYENDIEPEMESSEFSQVWWSMENEGLFGNNSEHSIFGYNELEMLRKLDKPFKPVPDELYLDKKALREWNKKHRIPKIGGEIRLLGLDVAMMGGENDNTVFTVVRLLPRGGKYRRQVVFIEHHNNAHMESQAIRMKQLYEDFDIDFACVDIQGVGAGVSDAAAKEQHDVARGKKYPAWTIFNRENMKDRVYGVDAEDALPLIYGIKQTAEFNHFMLTWLKKSIEDEKLELLVKAIEAEDILVDRNVNIDTYTLEEELKPFRETDLLVKELTSVEVETQQTTPYLRVKHMRMRKDRFSSLGFCNYYATLLERELAKPQKKNKRMSSYIAYN